MKWPESPSSLADSLAINVPVLNANAAMTRKDVRNFFVTNIDLPGRRILPHLRNESFAALLREREPWLTPVLGVVGRLIE